MALTFAKPSSHPRLGFLTSMVFITFVGVFFSSWLGGALLGVGEWLIKRLPFIQAIYSASMQARGRRHNVYNSASGLRDRQGGHCPQQGSCSPGQTAVRKICGHAKLQDEQFAALKGTLADQAKSQDERFAAKVKL